MTFYDVLILLIGVYLHEHLIVCSAITDCIVIYNSLKNKCIFIGNLFDSHRSHIFIIVL